MSEHSFGLPQLGSRPVMTDGAQTVVIVNETNIPLRCEIVPGNAFPLTLKIRQSESAPQAGDSDVTALAEAAGEQEQSSSYPDKPITPCDVCGRPARFVAALMDDGVIGWCEKHGPASFRTPQETAKSEREPLPKYIGGPADGKKVDDKYAKAPKIVCPGHGGQDVYYERGDDGNMYYRGDFSWSGIELQPKAEPEREQTWRDRPPML